MGNKTSNNLVFSLVDGRFDPADAASLISTLYHAKIEYHNLQILRHYEGRGKSLAEQKERIAALERSSKEFHIQMKQAIAMGYYVEIKADLEIDFIEK